MESRPRSKLWCCLLRPGSRTTVPQAILRLGCRIPSLASSSNAAIAAVFPPHHRARPRPMSPRARRQSDADGWLQERLVTGRPLPPSPAHGCARPDNRSTGRRRAVSSVSSTKGGQGTAISSIVPLLVSEIERVQRGQGCRGGDQGGRVCRASAHLYRLHRCSHVLFVGTGCRLRLPSRVCRRCIWYWSSFHLLDKDTV
jgi:hypothetical protein